jgi:hypothetical protein
LRNNSNMRDIFTVVSPFQIISHPNKSSELVYKNTYSDTKSFFNQHVLPGEN